MKTIFVKPTFIQQEGDKLIYETDEFVAISVASVAKYKSFRVYPADVTKAEKKITDKYIKELNSLCDQKSKGIKFLITGMKVSEEQMEEYGLVKEAVENNDVDFFKEEAIFFGTTAQEEFDKAKKAKEDYLLIYNKAKKLIRFFRRVVSLYIKQKDFRVAEKMIDEGRMIGLNDDGSTMKGNQLQILQVVQKQVAQIVNYKGEFIEEETK